MAQRGRPKNPASGERKNQLHISLTDAEHKALKEGAKVATIPLTTWARAVLLKAAKAEQGKGG
jgi:hypothetical protein